MRQMLQESHSLHLRKYHLILRNWKSSWRAWMYKKSSLVIFYGVFVAGGIAQLCTLVDQETLRHCKGEIFLRFLRSLPRSARNVISMFRGWSNKGWGLLGRDSSVANWPKRQSYKSTKWGCALNCCSSFCASSSKALSYRRRAIRVFLCFAMLEAPLQESYTRSSPVLNASCWLLHFLLPSCHGRFGLEHEMGSALLTNAWAKAPQPMLAGDLTQSSGRHPSIS